MSEPRDRFPKQTVGHGGCFGCIYSVKGAGGYQMFGITPVPIYDSGTDDCPFTIVDGVLSGGRYCQIQTH
ncbi:carboxyltransferase domain-containing protein [Vibrio sp. PP-XX7]